MTENTHKLFSYLVSQENNFQILFAPLPISKAIRHYPANDVFKRYWILPGFRLSKSSDWLTLMEDRLGEPRGWSSSKSSSSSSCSSSLLSWTSIRPLGSDFVLQIFSQSSQSFPHERTDTNMIRHKSWAIFNSWKIKLTNFAKLPSAKWPFLYELFTETLVYNCSASESSHFGSISLMRKNLRGLRENLRHKIRTSVSSGDEWVTNGIMADTSSSGGPLISNTLIN